VTEKEKMLNSEYYFGYDEQLVKEREVAKDLCFELNNIQASNRKKRAEIINELFGRVGKNPWIESSFYCDYGYNISVGDNFYTNHNLVILDVNKVIIGDNVLIGPNVGIYTAAHPTNPVTRKNGLEYGKPITIGNNVWVGGNVVILPGVTIGDNTVIGAGSVVTKDIPADVVAIGNPCQVVKNISEVGE